MGNILDLIEKRWSPYSFSSGYIEDEKIETLMAAAGRAPSANNEQPWLFLYTTKENKEKFDFFLGFLTESNRVWAKNAYAMIISFARLNSSYDGKPNRYAFHDTGMAVANLLTQASSMNIFIHQMGGYSIEKVRNYFNLRDDIEPVAVMAVGNIGDGTNIPEELHKRDEKRRPRKLLSEYSFKNNLPDYFKKKEL
jgi:nitroreductase